MKKKKNLSYLTRRQALSLMGISSATAFCKNPIDMLVSGLAEGIFQKAQANSGRERPRNYVYIHLAGGPNRWVFDMPLKPYGEASGFNAHPHVTTKFSGSGPHAGAPIYSTTRIIHGDVQLNMPWLWSCQLPTITGGTVPMGNLLANAVIIRGVNMEADGHETNADKQQRPNTSAPSLSGSVADGATTPIPALSLSGAPASAFRSRMGFGQIRVEPLNENALNFVLQPFRSEADGTQNFLRRREAIQNVLDRTLATLGEYARSNNPGAESLDTMRHQAERLLQQRIGDLKEVYRHLVAKYESLIAKCAVSQIPGITDRPIPANILGPNHPALTFQPGLLARNADLRTIIQHTTSIERLAAGFAMAEYLLTRGYSSSITFGVTQFKGLRLENVFDTVRRQGVGTQVIDKHFDEHFHGSVITLILDSFLYRALAACLYEFTRVLDSQRQFSETLIHIGSEFGRIPREDRSGSDHGWSASTTTLISGAIKKPIVLGNVLPDAANSSLQPLPKNWGSAARIRVDGTIRTLGVGNTASTVTELLRVNPVTPNFSTTLIENSSGISPTISLAKNKDET